MKKVTIILASASTFYSLSGEARVKPSSTTLGEKNLIKFNLSGMAVNTYMLQYERVLSNHHSLILALGFSTERLSSLVPNFKNYATVYKYFEVFQ